jgi:methionine-rich copper-binding protein CopC
VRKLVGIIAVSALAIAAAGLAVSVAGAHARLAESTPAVGEVLAASPPQVSITFTQEVQKITGTYGIDVFDASGAEVTAADAVLSDDDRHILTVDLQPALPVGRYVVQYKNVSDADGDPFEGAYAFYVGREPTAEELTADEQLADQEEEATPTTQPAASPTVAAIPTATASPTTPSGDGDDDAGGALTLIVVVAAIALVAVLVVVGYVAFSRQRKT